MADYLQPQRCKDGHEWTAKMFNENGGGFYVDEDLAWCPTCGYPDVLNERPSTSRGGRV